MDGASHFLSFSKKEEILKEYTLRLRSQDFENKGKVVQKDVKVLVTGDMKAELDDKYTQLRIMQDQLGTLFHIIAIEDSDQLKKLAEAATEWTQWNE